MNYACGFIFSPDLEHVVLIEKNKPEWQKGLLNGIGGKQEPEDRKPRHTMQRECFEETGLDIDSSDWTMFAELLEPKSKTRVVFFRTVSPRYDHVVSKTDERVGVYLTCDVLSRPTIPNLKWLIPLAMYWNEQNADMVVVMSKDMEAK